MGKIFLFHCCCVTKHLPYEDSLRSELLQKVTLKNFKVREIPKVLGYAFKVSEVCRACQPPAIHHPFLLICIRRDHTLSVLIKCSFITAMQINWDKGCR